MVGADGWEVRLEGPRAWTAVATAFASMFTVFGVAYSFGAFLTPMQQDFGSGHSATSAVFGITAFLYFEFGALSGAAVDRFGPRPVLLVGAVAMGAGMVATAAVHHLWLVYLTYGVGVGVGVACGYVPMVAVVGNWFDRRRSTAVGIAVAGIGVGTLVGAPLAAALIDSFGWRTTEVALGLAGAAVLVVCALLTSRPPMHATEVESVPLRETIRSASFRWLYLSGFFGSLALFVPFVYLPPFARDHGAGKVAAAALVGFIGAASVVGRLGLGALADRWGHVRTYRGCVAAMACSYAIWLVVSSYGLLVVFAIVLGVGYGGFIALSPSVAATLFGTRGLGGTLGVLYTSAGIGALVGPPAAGYLIDHLGGYRTALVATVAVATAAYLLLLPLRTRPAVVTS